MISRTFSFLCVLMIVFGVAFALDTCASEGFGPCVGGLCPLGYQCINKEVCCPPSDINVGAGQSTSQESFEIFNH